MSENLERLRRLVGLCPARARPAPRVDDDFAPSPDPDAILAAPPARHAAPAPDLDSDVNWDAPAAALPPGREIATRAGLCYVHEIAIPLDQPRGPFALGNLLTTPPARFARYHPNFNLAERTDYARAAFIDTETTGLGNGAGVYAFMVGVGTFEAYTPPAADQLPSGPDPRTPPTHFVVRQLFMRHPGEERALLLVLADLLAPLELTVTFNGRAFDLPLLRTRYAQNRRLLPGVRADLLAESGPHLDLLLPARRIWRRRLQSCRLLNLEQSILGIARAQADVPGYLIPELYQQYVRTGAAHLMHGVFYHNHEDIVSMVALADHLSRAFDPGSEATAPPTVQGLDWAGLARAQEASGDRAAAEQSYRRALARITRPGDRAELYQRLADLYKRQARWGEAADIWQEWITSVPGHDPTPYVELAKYCEWQTRELDQAIMWTGWALHTLRAAPTTARRPNILADLEHRLARLQRKASAD